MEEELEKKERGSSWMSFWRRGVLVEGHVEWQMLVHKDVSLAATIEFSWDETQAIVAKLQPSNRVNM